MSRQGGLGVGGGTAAGRHRAVSMLGGDPHRARMALTCSSCGRLLTATVLLHSGRVFCGSDCARPGEPAVPGQFLG